MQPSSPWPESREKKEDGDRAPAAAAPARGGREEVVRGGPGLLAGDRQLGHGEAPLAPARRGMVQAETSGRCIV